MKTTALPVSVAPALQMPCEGGARYALAALVEDHGDGAFGNDVGDGDRFFQHPALGIVGAAFPDLDDVDVGHPDAAAGRGRALAIALRELALGTLFQAGPRLRS